MSEFSHHEACPKCGSRDNVGVWKDGGKYCFGCGWGIKTYKGISKKELKQQLKRKEETGVCILPFDFDMEFLPKDWNG
jgi:Zn ribbon nucleic-acid-binding protein